MAIMAIYRASEVDSETFDRFRAAAPIEPEPPGAIFHQVAFDKDGLLVIDVWETEAQMQAFSADRLAPGLQRAGIGHIEPEVLQLHALWAAPDARRHNFAAPV